MCPIMTNGLYVCFLFMCDPMRIELNGAWRDAPLRLLKTVTCKGSVTVRETQKFETMERYIEDISQKSKADCW
jgi:hypothetical protein